MVVHCGNIVGTLNMRKSKATRHKFTVRNRNATEKCVSNFTVLLNGIIVRLANSSFVQVLKESRSSSHHLQVDTHSMLY